MFSFTCNRAAARWASDRNSGLYVAPLRSLGVSVTSGPVYAPLADAFVWGAYASYRESELISFIIENSMSVSLFVYDSSRLGSEILGSVTVRLAFVAFLLHLHKRPQ